MFKETVLSRSIGLVFSGHAKYSLSASTLLALSLCVSGSAMAQVVADAAATADAPPAQPAEKMQEVVVAGSRFARRIVADSPTPIDLISGAELARGGQFELQRLLTTLVPSYSVSAPATTGALDFTSTPTLRGLGPGELLLLINGKRRHSSGILNTANQIGRGDVGYDFSTVPNSAIGRIEVLRDGASAQYGADAISGVINLVLDKTIGASASIMTGMTSTVPKHFPAIMALALA